MWLITEDDLRHFKETDDQMVVTKLFLPWTRWTWYLTEYNQEEQIAQAYVKSGIDSNFDERWSVYIPELEELVIKIPIVWTDIWGLKEISFKIERDESFNWPRLFTSLTDELYD